MLQYQQLETLTYDRQATFLAEAEQRWVGSVDICATHTCQVSKT